MGGGVAVPCLWHCDTSIQTNIDCILLLRFWQGTTKINLAVDTLPQFKCCRSKMNHVDLGPEHMGTIHIGSERYGIISESRMEFKL